MLEQKVKKIGHSEKLAARKGEHEKPGKRRPEKTATAEPLPLAVSREKAKERTKNAAFTAATMTDILDKLDFSL